MPRQSRQVATGRIVKQGHPSPPKHVCSPPDPQIRRVGCFDTEGQWVFVNRPMLGPDTVWACSCGNHWRLRETERDPWWTWRAVPPDLPSHKATESKGYCFQPGVSIIQGEVVAVRCGRPEGHDDEHRVVTDWAVPTFCPHSHGVEGITCLACSQLPDHSHLTVVY